jgi:cytochrome c5
MPPAQVVQMRCTVCHATDLLEQQRLTQDGWRRELAKMIGWGAAIDAARVDEIAAYLAERYAPAPRPRIAADTGAGSALVRTRCTVCHATDLIAAQRLGADGWRRELAKMTGWGAVLSASEQEAVLDYLQSDAFRR